MATLPAGLKKPARSCGPCRKSKVKCDRKFPCSRCLRMRIPCEDPTTGGVEDTTAGLISICHMLPTLAAAPAFALCLSRYGPKELAVDKASSVMKVLAAVYRRKGCERLKRVVEALAQGLSTDFESLVRPRTEAEDAADRALLAGHFPFELKSAELRPEQALHPYAIELFKEPFTTMAAVLVGGDERVFVNEGWAKAFFEEGVARQRLEEGLRPTEIFAAIVHPDDRAFVVPLLDNCLFGCSDTLSESAHLFRCQSPRTQATFVALARLRAIVTPEGYLCTVYSVQPLPYPADMVRVSMPVGGVVAGRHPWTEFIDQHERGEHSDMAAPISAGPSSAASVASSGSSVGSSWSTRRHPRGTGGRRSGARRGGIQEEDEEDEEDYDDSGRESFRSSDVGRESFRERESFRYSDAGYSEDDGGRDSVLSVTAEEAARAVAALGVSDSTPRSSLGEDRPSGAAAAGAAAVLFHAGQHLSGGEGNGGDGAGGLRPPQPPV